jgi:hypothetical protein
MATRRWAQGSGEALGLYGGFVNSCVKVEMVDLSSTKVPLVDLSCTKQQQPIDLTSTNQQVDQKTVNLSSRFLGLQRLPRHQPLAFLESGRGILCQRRSFLSSPTSSRTCSQRPLKPTFLYFKYADTHFHSMANDGALSPFIVFSEVDVDLGLGLLVPSISLPTST